MKGLFAVAWREIVERRMVLLAAALLGLLVFLVPLFPGAARYGASQARLFTAGFSAATFCAFVAFLLGGSTIGRDLTERRLGFYFSRPIAEGAIWGGKFLGIWVLVAASALALVLPVGLADFASWWPAAGAWRTAQIALLFAAAVLFALALGSVVGASLRERSVWTLADLAMLGLLALGLAAILFPLFQADAPALTTRVAGGLAVGISLSLLLASFAQVAVGRVDQRRGTRARFAVLWGVLVLVAVGCLGSVRWLVSPVPEDLTSASVRDITPRGNWIVLRGRARHRVDLTASFFYDVASGHFVRPPLRGNGGMVLSEDGSTGAWSESCALDGSRQCAIWVCRLEGHGSRPRRLPLEASISDLRLSQQGRRLAVAGPDTISVFDVSSGGLLAGTASESEQGKVLRFAFVSEDVLRLYRFGPRFGPPVEADSESSRAGTLAIEDLHVVERSVTRASRIEGLGWPFSVGFDDRHGRVVVWEKEGSVALFDASSGARIANLGQRSWDEVSRAFLFDGRLVLAETTGGAGRLQLFRQDGTLAQVFELGPAGFVQIGGEPQPGVLALSISRNPKEVWAAADSFLLDLRSGSLAKVAAHASPVAARLRWRLPYIEPGSAAARLFARPDGTLLLWDPKDSSLRVIPPLS
ncbi:MAG TPA: WD40 repeat domain-containing protein [Thermoanaerobaculia bacterium]|nr:WD40 repeat domain-containing protein [Thermoanaerobaculia bacterium]